MEVTVNYNNHLNYKMIASTSVIVIVASCLNTMPVGALKIITNFQV